MATPCLEWQAGRDRAGYGRFGRAGKHEKTYRVTWEIVNGPIPDGVCVLHRCDNPCCVAGVHLFVGTNVDNVADRDAKCRQARGGAHGAHMHPGCVPRLFGEANGNAKLTEGDVRRIFELREQGWSQRRLAAKFGVSNQQISRILARKIWAHVELETPS